MSVTRWCHTALCVCVKWSVEYQLREGLDKQRLSDRLQYTTKLCWTSDHLDDTADDYTGHRTDVSQPHSVHSPFGSKFSE